MTKHKFRQCQCGNCPVCDWDAGICVNCNCAEGTLPTDCPGVVVDGDAQDRVFTGETDYKGGEWIVPERDSSGYVVRIADDSTPV